MISTEPDRWPSDAQRPTDAATETPAEVPVPYAEAAQRVVEAMDARDGPGALQRLRDLIASVENDASVRWLWAAAQTELGDTIANVPSPEDDEKFERIICAYRSALEFYSPTVLAAQYARLEHNLAVAYLDRNAGSREENLEHAIEALHEAMRVRTPENDPYGWARSQNVLGNVLAARIHGDHAQNQRDAIAAYELALEIHRPETYPDDYRMARTNLALTLQEYVAGVQTENLDRAIVGFMCVLLVTPPTWPQYRRAALSLAAAFSVRLQLTPPAWRAEVSAALQPAIDVLREADLRYGIPTDAVGRATGAHTSAEATPLDPANGESWLPAEELFLEHRDLYFTTLPLPNLLGRLDWPEVQRDPEHTAAILRVVLSRHGAMDELLLSPLRPALLRRLGKCLLMYESGNAAENEEGIAAFEQALELDPLTEDAEERALIHGLLGECYGARVNGERAENLERAIEHIEVAIASCPPESDPDRWARFTVSRGQLYRDRRLGVRQDNLSRAVKDFTTAEAVLTKTRYPYVWARIKNSLGVAYRELSRTNEAAVELAIAAFGDALTVLTREQYSEEWSGVQQNLSESYRNRRSGGRAHNLELALQAAEAALSGRDRETHPRDWARLHHNFGQMYRERIEGDRDANLAAAAEHFRLALGVHTIGDVPADHRATVGALGMVLADQGDWPAALEAFQSASSAEELLLADVNTGAHGSDDVLLGGHNVGEVIGFGLVMLGRPADAVAAVERGRARSLETALTLRAARPERIRDPGRRERFAAASQELLAAQAAVNLVIWGDSRAEPSDGLSGRSPRWRREALEFAERARAAGREFDAVVAEIQEAADPPDLLTPRIGAHELSARIDSPVVYLVCTEWGGMALAVLPSDGSDRGADEPAVQLPLADLTDAFINDLVQVQLDDGTDRIVGGFAAAQEGISFDLLTAAWPGDTFAQKVEQLTGMCRDRRLSATLPAAAEEMLTLEAPGLAELASAGLLTLPDTDVARLAATLAHGHLSAELDRCLPKLADVVMRPTVQWLTGLGFDAATFVPCAALAAFPLLAVPIDDGGRTVADRLTATVAPSGRAILGASRARHPGEHRGAFTLGDPRPTHQPLRWGEAEALTIAMLAGDPERARVGEHASREWLVECLARGDVVFASCHGRFDGTDFLQSALLLANDERLTLGEALGAHVDLGGVRLFVLSACQTAVLDLRGASGEVRSLASGMLQAGAGSVMGSLWSVDDRATYLLMVRFAQEWLPRLGEEPPASALARAQAWLRTATNDELAGWKNRIPAGLSEGIDQDQRGIETVRGRGERYSAPEAAGLVAGLFARKAADAPDEVPYAAPVFWAGFQIHGR